MNVDLPTPGGPESPMRKLFPSRRGCSLASADGSSLESDGVELASVVLCCDASVASRSRIFDRSRCACTRCWGLEDSTVEVFVFLKKLKNVNFSRLLPTAMEAISVQLS